MLVARKIIKILRDFCENSSLVGLGYMSNQKIHITERIFWFICLIITAGGSYYVIRQYQDAFDSQAISLGMEETRPQDKTELPALAACEVIDRMSVRIADWVNQLPGAEEVGYQRYDIEDYLTRIMFLNVYNTGSLESYCKPHFNCSDCLKCPTSGYKEFAKLMHANCSELLVDCVWNGKPFNCCDYFLPLQTPIGICFFLNSKLTTTRKGQHWLNTEIGWDSGFIGNMQLTFKVPTTLYILNAEDIPLPLYFEGDRKLDLKPPGVKKDIQINVQDIINDPVVRDIDPNFRRCRFPDENTDNSGYDVYSVSTCAYNCFKKLQLEICGCVSYNYLTGNDKNPSCDYDGFICLDKNVLLKFDPRIMQPWRQKGPKCNCFPSCTERKIDVIQQTDGINISQTHRYIKIRQTKAHEQFHRQAVRTRLDVVVTIGGILGLFMGASILSGIEILYFFLIRIFYLRN